MRLALSAPIACALACGGEPPAFPSSHPGSSSATLDASADADASASSTGDPTSASLDEGSAPGSSSGGDDASGDDTSTGPSPDPVVCADDDGLCHTALAPMLLGTALGPIAVGDLDGDGALDLVVVDQPNEVRIGVLLGVGDGTFAPPPEWTHLPPLGEVTSLVVASLDGDDLPDVAVASQGLDGIVILRGDGQGELLGDAALEVVESPQSIVAGDFNVDGMTDLAVALSDQRIVVLHGAADSVTGFGPPIDHPLPHRPSRLVTTEAFGGLLGLVVTSRLDAEVSALAGSVVGGFVPLDHLSVEQAPVYADVADFDRDGEPDLVSVHRMIDGRVSVRLGAGPGQWRPVQVWPSIAGPSDAAVADMNVDGFPDVVVCADIDDGVAILQGQPGGSLAPPVHYPGMVEHARLVVADFNGDGAPDVASTGGSPGVLLVVLSHAR